MVTIIPHFMPLVCVLLGREITLMAGVDELDDNHVVSWIRNGVEITQGTETLIGERITPRFGANGEASLEIRNAEVVDRGTYSLRVYERRCGGTLHQIAEETVVSVDVSDGDCKDGAVLQHVGFQFQSKIRFSQQMWHVCVKPGKSVTLEIVATDGVRDSYLISWIRNEEEITRGEEKLTDDHCSERIFPRVGSRGEIMLDIRNAESVDEGTYWIKVYEEINGQSFKIAEEFVAVVEFGECNNDGIGIVFKPLYQKMLMRDFEKKVLENEKNKIYYA